MIIRNIKMHYIYEFVLADIENADSIPNEGIKVLAYNKGEFLGGTAFDSDIPPSLLAEFLEKCHQSSELDKIVVILDDGRKVSKKF